MWVSSVTRFEALLVWAQAVAMSGIVLLATLLLHPLLLLAFPLAAMLPFLFFLRPFNRLPRPEARLIDAGVTLGHGWVLTDDGLTWLPRAEVGDVAQSLSPVPIVEHLTPDGVTLRAVQAAPLFAPLGLWWRTVVVMTLVGAWPGIALLDGGFASAMVIERVLTVATFLLGVGALSAVWMLPYTVLVLLLSWERMVEVRLCGRLLHAGGLKVEVHDPEVDVRYADGVPQLTLTQDGRTLAIHAPVPILAALTEQLATLPARPGTAREVPSPLVACRSKV